MLLNKTDFYSEKPWCFKDVSWPTSDFEGHNLFSLDKVDDLLVDTGGDGVSIDAHNLVTNLFINTGYFITDYTFTVNISFVDDLFVALKCHGKIGWIYHSPNDIFIHLHAFVCCYGKSCPAEANHSNKCEQSMFNGLESNALIWSLL